MAQVVDEDFNKMKEMVKNYEDNITKLTSELATTKKDYSDLKNLVNEVFYSLVKLLFFQFQLKL